MSQGSSRSLLGRSPRAPVEALQSELHELSERLREREEQGGANVTTTEASSSSCNGGGEEVNDDKRHDAAGCCLDLEPPESYVLGGVTCHTPTDVSAVDSDQYDDELDYDEGLIPESFCATPELWEPWPLVEWNAVA
ncbi:hypothetical protein GUJ93_ZPchr0004g39161 [Zizania palustris]|uniref:Uncharacterized protein n=1 Tax=Zizania palustris TaxID=103762 RepID=A0A8J5SGR8_ZIZPA|nr:hypothetical protein GUJ93_ZPchr0004g39161 [Zizania palustris]